MIPLLFLDIDGVLNSRRSRTSYALGDPRRLVDPAAVAHLNAIVERTGCHVVLSSTWRLPMGIGIGETMRRLRAAGFASKLFGVTPDLGEARDAALFDGRLRGTEIQAWIDRQPWGSVGPIAILDDEDDMGPLLPRLVRTNIEDGLHEWHVERAVVLLLRIGDTMVRP